MNPEGKAGPRSDVVARLNDGDALETQVTRFPIVSLFGDVTSQFNSGRRHRARWNLVSRFRDSVRYRPLQPLTAGSHVVVLKVSDLAGNPAQKSWSFTVDSKSRDHLDDKPATTGVTASQTTSTTSSPGSWPGRSNPAPYQKQQNYREAPI